MVTNLTASNTSYTSIAVTWFKPTAPNGLITEYEIGVYKKDAERCTQQVVLYCSDCQNHCSAKGQKNKIEKVYI